MYFDFGAKSLVVVCIGAWTEVFFFHKFLWVEVLRVEKEVSEVVETPWDSW